MCALLVCELDDLKRVSYFSILYNRFTYLTYSGGYIYKLCLFVNKLNGNLSIKDIMSLN